jgi:hypothetical protein
MVVVEALHATPLPATNRHGEWAGFKPAPYGGRNDEAIGGKKVLGGGFAAAQHPLSSKKRRHVDQAPAGRAWRHLLTVAPTTPYALRLTI